MKQTALFLLLAVFIATAKATNHTQCFNYFMEKDGCVFSSANDKTRCSAAPKTHADPVQMISFNSDNSGKSSRLTRRADTTQPPFPIGGGSGNCGYYDSTTEIGVCLWNGAEQDNPTVQTAGWLNSQKTSNCGKRIYIQRTGKPDTVQYAKVIDGCSFNATEPKYGCFQVGVTIDLFNLFKPSEIEQTDQRIYGGLTWDFDNLYGQSTQQGPV